MSMNLHFPEPNFDRTHLDRQAELIIDSHNEAPHQMNRESLEMRKEEGGILIRPYEVPYMKKMIMDRVEALKHREKELNKILGEYPLPSQRNLAEERASLTKEYNYLTQNFAEKFF